MDNRSIAAAQSTGRREHGQPSTPGRWYVGNFIDERLGIADLERLTARNVLPDHWSFMLGEVALQSLSTCLLPGTYIEQLLAEDLLARVGTNGAAAEGKA